MTVAEYDYWTKFWEIRNDKVIKSLYKAAAEALIKGEKEVYHEIREIIMKELRINYSVLSENGFRDEP